VMQNHQNDEQYSQVVDVKQTGSFVCHFLMLLGMICWKGAQRNYSQRS